MRAQLGTSCSPCIVSTCLEEMDDLKAQGIDEGTIRDFSTGVYADGADTVGFCISRIVPSILTTR